MPIGALQRTAIAFTGLVIAFAVILFVTPIGASSANDRPTAFAGGPEAHPPKQAGDAGLGNSGQADKPKPEPKQDEPTQDEPTPEPKADEPELGEDTNAAGEPLDVTDGACKENLAIAAKAGLTLPDGWDINCVGPGLDWSGNSHWGVTCPYDSCPEGAGPYVSISNPNYYVIAHELCHANFGTDELAADECAAEHGASLETSPYQ
jgi:hypothetical protein